MSAELAFVFSIVKNTSLEQLQMSIVTVYLICPDFWLQYFCKLVISTDPSQGIYRVIESRSVRSVTLYYMKSHN
jgi:hypothetical protein